MKKIIRFISAIVILSVSIIRSNAQCRVSNIVIQNITGVNATTGSCTVKFDASFNIENNKGNKYIFLNAWLQNDYTDYFKCENGQTTINGSIKAPVAADLGHTLISMGLWNKDPMPVILKTYPPDASVPMAIMDSVKKQLMPDGSVNFILYGVVASAPVPCGTAVVVMADLWSSQSSDAQRVHCVNCGIRYSTGFLEIVGAVDCAAQLFNGTIKNITLNSISGYYTVYADVNNDAHFTMYDDTLLKTNTYFDVAPGATISISGNLPPANRNQDIFIVVTQTIGSAIGASRVFLFPSGQCPPAPLSVTFVSFTAIRNSSSNVLLQWQTSAEINNKGFTIEKSNSNNQWIASGFIPSQAPGGSGGVLLTYSFNDNNSSKGITRYRIKQTDLDGQSEFSETRSVRGDAQKAKTIIYPNPAVNGQVNISFEEGPGARDIYLTDLDGRTVKEWRFVTKNNFRIESLRPGIYILKVISKQTGDQTLDRIIVLRDLQ